MISTKSQCKIGLALSGGGVRAAAFHAGVLQWLAEKSMLEQVQHISSVSGGSLFTGLVFHSSNYRWPSSSDYLSQIFDKVRWTLTEQCLQTNAIVRLSYPANCRFWLSRANILAQSIEKLWGISATLPELPSQPAWSINGTTAETGRRFRFKNNEIGDYEIGYAAATDFKLAEAMAVSAAFPFGIGPLAIEVARYKWLRRKEWNISLAPEPVELPYSHLHVYDGGVYDNLGLEPLFDMGKQILKNEGSNKIDFIIASDAGAPFMRSKIPGPFHPRRLRRVAEVGFDQARALRVRSFVNFITNNKKAGMYVQIGAIPKERLSYFKSYLGESLELALSMKWLEDTLISQALHYPTTLKCMDRTAFDNLARHGYETMQWNDLLFGESNPLN